MSISSTLFPMSLVDQTNSSEEINAETEKNVSIVDYLLTNLTDTTSSASSSEAREVWSYKVPKILQGIATLLVCAILLIVTIGIIQQVKKWRGKGDRRIKIEAIELAVTPKSSDNENQGANGETAENRDLNNKNFMHYSSGRPQPHQAAQIVPAKVEPKKSIVKQQSVKGAKEVPFLRPVRRTSGPFGDDTIDFYGESSYKKDIAKELRAGSKKCPAEVLDNTVAEIKTKSVPGSESK